MAELEEEILGKAEFKFIKNLKAHLVRSKLPDFDEVCRSNPCGGKRPPCHLSENMKDTCTF